MDANRVRFISANYHDLHGLRWMIMAVVFFAVAAEDAGVLEKWILLLLIVPLGLAGFMGVGYFYMQRYGNAIQSGQKKHVIISNWAFIPLMIGAMAVDEALGTRIFISPFVMAAWFVGAFALAGPRYRWHYFALAAAIVIANLLISGVDFPPDSPWLRRGVVTWTLAGGAMLIGGLLDHLFLTRSLKGGVLAHE